MADMRGTAGVAHNRRGLTRLRWTDPRRTVGAAEEAAAVAFFGGCPRA